MKKGFTIIELLVVVAIIALLATIVIISIDSLNARGANTSIKTNLNQIRQEAALYREHESSGSYEGLCTANNPYRILDQYNEARSRALGIGKCGATAEAWVIAVPLNQREIGVAAAWCVDSENAGVGITAERYMLIQDGSSSALCQ